MVLDLAVGQIAPTSNSNLVGTAIQIRDSQLRQFPKFLIVENSNCRCEAPKSLWELYRGKLLNQFESEMNNTELLRLSDTKGWKKLNFDVLETMSTSR